MTGWYLIQMTMIMSNKYAKFLGVIEEALKYCQSGDDKIEILESTFLNAGLTMQDLTWSFKKSAGDKIVIQQQTLFAPNKTQSSYPKAAALSSTPNSTYNQLAYLLKIDRLALVSTDTKPAPGDKPIFDENNGKVLFNNKECQIPIKSNQYLLCKKMFNEPFGLRVKEIDVLDMIDWAKDKKRRVYDAMRAVNAKAEEGLGIERSFQWKMNTIWIREKW